MKKFAFRLESVIRLRNTQLEREQQKLQALLAQDQLLRDSLAALEVERKSASSSLHSGNDVSALDLRSLSAFTVGAHARSLTIQESIARQRQPIAEQRARLLQAERDVQLLNKLKRKRLTEWTAEMEREIELGAQEAWLTTHRPGSTKRSEATLPNSPTSSVHLGPTEISE